MIWEYLEKSNLSAQAGCSRVDPVRVSWPAEPLSIIFEKSQGTRSLTAQELPQQLVLRCWSVSGHPLPSQLRNFVYFPDTGPPHFEGIWSDLKSLGKTLSFSEVGFISADCRSVKVTQWSKLIILSLLSQKRSNIYPPLWSIMGAWEFWLAVAVHFREDEHYMIILPWRTGSFLVLWSCRGGVWSLMVAMQWHTILSLAPRF